jgi:hypothetical protein
MAHAQKPNFVFRRNGRVHLNRRGLQFSRLLAAEVCTSAVVMLDTPCSEVVKGTGHPLHSPVSPSLPLPCVTVCHHISIGVYLTCVILVSLNKVATFKGLMYVCVVGYYSNFVGYGVMFGTMVPTFRKNLLPLSSGYK